MPNTITITAQAQNTAKTVEYLHPNTGQWQDSNVLTGVSPGTYNSHQVRLKGSNPAITATSNTSVTVTGAVVQPPQQAVYDTTLTSTNPEGGSISFATSNGHKISFNAINGAAGSPADTVLVWNGQTSFATIPSEYLNQPFAFHDGNGTRHDTTAGGAQAKFIDGTVTF